MGVGGQQVAERVDRRSSCLSPPGRDLPRARPALFAAAVKSRRVRKPASTLPPLKPAPPSGKSTATTRPGAQGRASTRASRARSPPIRRMFCRLECGCGNWAGWSLNLQPQRPHCCRTDSSSGCGCKSSNYTRTVPRPNSKTFLRCFSGPTGDITGKLRGPLVSADRWIAVWYSSKQESRDDV